MKEGFSEIMTLEETAKYLKIGKSTLYKMARQGKISAVKIEPRRNNKIIIRIPYNQDLINKVKSIPRREWNPKGRYREVPFLESGINLRYIQELSGHKSSKTTEIYTHVSTKNLSAINNPLDNLLKGCET